MPIAARLDRLYLPADYSRSISADSDYNKSVIRLLGLQNGWLSTMAGITNAKATM